ncbi:glycosyltransferase family 2 protein [Candidatus Saccharibacteria bacterium]|nr:glycosyltransferase family 2 protein [Candidatus Saccharibacteria bacterium]MCA9313409.1 glycosyltransferase family 2 protein [Candidatus Saccharibacteria bacterium]
MTASIVVVNWNGLRFLETFFDSLNGQTYDREDYEIIMVDNNSSDDSVAFTEKNYPAVRIVKHHSNSGFAKGCNIGIRKALGKYIVLINNDMFLDKDWLESLIQSANKSSSSIGAVVSKVMFKNKKGYINNVGSILEAGSDWPVKDRGFMEKDTGQYNKREEVSAFCGASVLLKRSMLESIGLFDQNFFMYFEDADLSWRGSRADWGYLYEPRSVAYHEHTGSSKEGSPFFTFYVSRNRLLILLKNGSRDKFLKAFRELFQDRLILPFKAILTSEQNRSAALAQLTLGLRIYTSFFIHAPCILAKRYRLIGERSL